MNNQRNEFMKCQYSDISEDPGGGRSSTFGVCCVDDDDEDQVAWKSISYTLKPSETISNTLGIFSNFQIHNIKQLKLQRD
jgi:hypothetical protein